MKDKFNCFKCGGKQYTNECNDTHYIDSEGLDAICLYRVVADNDLINLLDDKGVVTLGEMLKEYLKTPDGKYETLRTKYIELMKGELK